MKRYALLIVGAVAMAAFMMPIASASTVVDAAHGTWTAYPGQEASTFQTAVQPPINTDGTSNFKANGHAVIPVKFGLSQVMGPFVFESIWSDNADAANNYSYLYFDPDTNPTLADITTLIANYDFTTGDCAGGSLRWTLYLLDGTTTRKLDVHYQPGENGLSSQFCKGGTSGANMADTTSTDPYVVIQEFTYAGSPYSFTSAYNVTYSEAVSQLGTLKVSAMNLILDSGWANGDQVVDLTSATVGVGGGTSYSETFTPEPASSLSPVCPTAEASIMIEKTDGAASGPVNEPVSIQPKDDNGLFRIVDCKYMYNLATSSLSGVGTYTVSVVIDGTQATGPAVFDLK